MTSTPYVRLMRLAERQHSAFTRHQALRCGFSADLIDRFARNGVWLRLHRCVYCVAGFVPSFETQALAAIFAAGPGAISSHDSAARLWHVQGEWSDQIHVTEAHRKGIIVRGVVVHQTRVSPETTKIGPIPVTTPARTLLDVAPNLSDDALEDAVDDVRRRGLVSAEKMLRIVQAQRKPGRVGLPRLEAILRARIGEPVSGSGKENDLGRLFRDAGLPTPAPQYVIREPDGSFVAQPDFAYPDAKIAIEFDGYENHASRRQWEHGRLRESRMAALGWLYLVVTDRQLKKLPDHVIRNVWRALAVRWAAEPRETQRAARLARPRRR